MFKVEPITQVFKDDQWTDIRFESIKKGDRFRIIKEGSTIDKVALEDAFLDTDGLWCVMTDVIDK